MWYLAINRESERFFIKKKDEVTVYIIKEDYNKCNIIKLSELQLKEFRIVGVVDEFEETKMEMILNGELKETL